MTLPWPIEIVILGGKMFISDYYYYSETRL